jgi:hypothetical protein
MQFLSTKHGRIQQDTTRNVVNNNMKTFQYPSVILGISFYLWGKDKDYF